MPLIRMCIESETVDEIPGEKSLPFDYTVVESVFLLEDRLFIMVGGTLSTAPFRSALLSFNVPYTKSDIRILLFDYCYEPYPITPA